MIQNDLWKKMAIFAFVLASASQFETARADDCFDYFQNCDRAYYQCLNNAYGMLSGDEIYRCWYEPYSMCRSMMEHHLNWCGQALDACYHTANQICSQ